MNPHLPTHSLMLAVAVALSVLSLLVSVAFPLLLQNAPNGHEMSDGRHAASTQPPGGGDTAQGDRLDAIPQPHVSDPVRVAHGRTLLI